MSPFPNKHTRSISYERPWLYEKQFNALFHSARYGIIEASTKSGKTHGCILWLFELAITAGGKGKNYWWIAPVYPQAEIAFRRMRDAIPPLLRTPNESKLTLTLPHGAVIWFKSGEKPDNLYGEDVYGAVIDEATRTREESWWAIRTTLTKTQGPVRIIGNVKGRKNWAYKIARKAESGESDMHYSKIIAADAVAAGILTANEVADAKRNLPEQVFKELFLAEPSDDGGNPFGLSHIVSCISNVSMDIPVAFGIDLAKSEDWTVVIGLDAHGCVCRFDRFHKIPWQEIIERIHLTVGRASALVDSTGLGDPVLESLQRGGNSTRYEGFKFSAESKQKIMEGLAVAIQGGKIKFPDGPIRSELEAFEYEYTRTGVRYSAPQGVHDDCVCALALAWHKCNISQGVKPQVAQVYQPRKNVGPASYGTSPY